jgi:hypothetical protein
MTRRRVADPGIGDTPVSCRRDSRGEFVTMADAIETLIARHPGLTAAQISQTLFANECESERVNLICRRLIAEGRIKRRGSGTIASPFAYAPKRAILPAE